MTARPSVSVVMPFAGDPADARAALAALAALSVAPGDERILADNAGLGAQLAPPDGVRVIDAAGERSPAHARNAGATAARGDWILFLDADTIAPPDLLDRFFIAPVDAEIGALAGEIVPAPPAGRASLAERYGEARSFLSQRAHLAHRYLPRAAAANLMVRREAFTQVGGFLEGLRAAEDTDFSWRLQQSGWRLELRVEAHVEHRYRTTINDLRTQWRGYAAGRAWLGRRYPGFDPEPAAARAVRRVAGRGLPRRVRTATRPATAAPAPQRPASAVAPRSRRDRAAFFALDVLLAGEELAGFALSNRPASPLPEGFTVVLVAEHFPAEGDPLVEFALTLERARIEAAGRPERIDPRAAGLRIDYREDDGAGARAVAAGRLLARHPGAVLRDRIRPRAGGPALTALAPAVARLGADPGARVHALGGDPARTTAGRLAALAGAGPAGEHPGR